MNNSISFKEKRIKEILLAYYSRKDVREAIFRFSENRECIPRYFEGFGKRPDAFQYESDIFEMVKRGATSFHSSEELWDDPLEISTELNPDEFNNLRIGWDLLLDIDSPYLEYSKIYADLLIKVLRFHGIKNLGIKFSGSKGFHIIIPWNSFPEEVYGQKTKDMFPEWPRIICSYLTEILQPKLAEQILEDSSLSEMAKKTGRNEDDLVITECSLCNRPAVKKELVTWHCPFCKNEVVMIRKTKRIPKCPNDDCRKSLVEISKKTIYACEFCNVNSNKNPEYFKKIERFATEKIIEADLILVSPRHLFRMPYSLHEKTALSSVVIDPDNIRSFQITDAKPFKVKVKDFYPISEKGEARNLLLQALDWYEQKNKEEQAFKEIRQESAPIKKSLVPKSDFKKITIPHPSDKIFPPCIKSLLKGVMQDGRKRALFLLLNFFKSLGLDDLEIEKRIEEWNKLNYIPLKSGYIRSQLNWYSKNLSRLPPNCDKPNYRELNICNPDNLCKKIKNPVSYAVKKYFLTK